ncbi:WhiB family transcriptional regulator [Rhodococcus qingshengii]|uniref:Transcriptional regulator WhiB n=1 Tax=Rhodococcus qingshengii TaxID=334542 RepID=A0AAW6LVA3_RHOSG|nr:WhiB family transcriptional regulator [Rhodococcus qingshengii]MDE8649077.1 WhiB family transcriptional regulator [Rhodococcus qingshengii]
MDAESTLARLIYPTLGRVDAAEDRDDETWRWSALCAQSDPDEFFPDKQGRGGSVLAKRVCARCPVSAECLDFALENHEEYGIWGGKTRRERRALRSTQAVAAAS